MSATAPLPIQLDALNPLPIRLKRVHHESMDSYIRRVANANGTTATTVGIWLHETGVLPKTISRATWHQAWDRLSGEGCLEYEARRPGTIPDRALCRFCARGVSASGQLPRWGLVCLRHRCWIDPHDGGAATRAELKAERHFRTELARRDLHMESARMEFALRLVALAVSPRWLRDNAAHGSAQTLRAQLFAPQVKIAVDLFASDELVTMARTEPAPGLVVLEKWIKERIENLGLSGEPWRAAGLMSSIVQEIINARPGLDLDQLIYRLSW